MSTLAIDVRPAGVAADFYAPPWARVAPGAGGALFGTRVRDARHLPDDAYERAVSDAYATLHAAVRAAGHARVARMWNGIGGIHDRVGGGRLDRYMLFNAGRYAAMRAWYGDDLARRAPAASGVGIDGDDLVVHAWATSADATAVQNPRQVPAAAYSSRYGPLPPCFARATLTTLDGAAALLVSGTAAIVGEDSVHVGDAAAQLDVTCDHLAHVVAASGLASEVAGDPRSAYASLRAYVPDERSNAMIAARLGEAFPNAGPVEFVRAQLCRRELLVEVEGVARET